MIPALDEEEALPGVLAAIPTRLVDKVIVVDNGSRDNTAEVARKAGAAVVRAPERGYGSACLAGLAALAALPTPPDVVAFLDADQSDDPRQLPLLLEPIFAGAADMVVGVRRSTGDRGDSVPIHARLGNALVLALTARLFGARFSDLGPFRAVSFESLQRLGMDDRNWGWIVQMQVRAIRAGLRIREVWVDHRPRAAGRSKVSGSVVGSLMAGTKMLYTLFREFLRQSPERR